MKTATQEGFTRRSFLTGTAAAGAGLALASTLQASADEVEATEAVEEETPAWLGEAPNISDDDVTAEAVADVIVVGVSDAGAIAVRSAVEAGASVIIIEKSAGVVGSGGDVALINGDVQARFGRDNIDVDEVVQLHQMECSYHTKEPIMRRYANEVADVFDWIIAADPDIYIAESSFEIIDDDVLPHTVSPDRYPEPDPDWDYHNEVIPTFPTTVGFMDLTTVLQCNVDLAKSEGDVAEYYGYFAEELIMEDGRCVGVYARDGVNGGYLKAMANNGVILCTGDYSSDETMLEEFVPEVIDNGIIHMWAKTDIEGNATNTGDGHRMGVRAGAKMQQWHAPMIHHMGSTMGINGYLMLNLNGKRFMNEDIPGQQFENQIELQPQKTIYQFFDANWKDQLYLFPSAHGAMLYYFEDEIPTSLATYGMITQATFDSAVESGTVLSGDTIEELLAKIEGMDTETAAASIERYNELCSSGVDSDFGKLSRRLFPLENPPYYATALTPTVMLVCVGGLTSDEECHTYDENDEIIPGLYVAGNVQGDRFAVQYPISLCGLSVGMAMFYGYVAGQNAALGA